MSHVYIYDYIFFPYIITTYFIKTGNKTGIRPVKPVIRTGFNFLFNFFPIRL